MATPTIDECIGNRMHHHSWRSLCVRISISLHNVDSCVKFPEPFRGNVILLVSMLSLFFAIFNPNKIESGYLLGKFI